MSHIIKETQGATHCIIMLHGLGADGHDLELIPNQFKFDENIKINWYFPHAKTRAVGINHGLPCSAWFDIKSFDKNEEINFNHDHLTESVNTIANLILDISENNNIETDNIILGGFSQGAVIAMHVGMIMPYKISGVFALSSFLPFFQSAKEIASTSNKNTPFFLAHGTKDTVIPIEYGEKAYSLLKNENYQAVWKTYNQLNHQIGNQEIIDLQNWLQELIYPNL